MRKFWHYAKSPVILGSLLVLLFLGAKWGWDAIKAPIPAPPKTPCVQISVGPNLEPWRVSVAVLNGGSRTGLANRQATVLRHAGFNVTKAGNTKERVRKTTIVGQSEKSPEVALVASYFIDPNIVADGRVDRSVDVLLGNDFPGNTDKPLKSVPVPDGQICLPKDTPTTPPK